MGFFDFLKSKKTEENNSDVNSNVNTNENTNMNAPESNQGTNTPDLSIFEDKNITGDDLKRISEGAGHIINMFTGVFKTPKGTDIKKALLFSSGIAGYACHNAVKKINPNMFVQVKTKDGKNYYFGDAVNKYLAENKYSVLSFASGSFKGVKSTVAVPDPRPIFALIANNVGNADYKVWNEITPGNLYVQIKQCYEGIYDNMTKNYCKNVSEEPILFGIVLQNIMINAMTVAPHDEVFKLAIESAVMVSKMDDDSL